MSANGATMKACKEYKVLWWVDDPLAGFKKIYSRGLQGEADHQQKHRGPSGSQNSERSFNRTHYNSSDLLNASMVAGIADIKVFRES